MTTWVEARAAKRTRDVREARHYTPDLLGRLCPACKQRVPIALNEVGEEYHATCGPAARAGMR